MSDSADAWLRRGRRTQAPEPEPEPEQPRRPLISQGTRGPAPQPVYETPDSLLRGRRGERGWQRVA